jgi:hypothetical protein
MKKATFILSMILVFSLFTVTTSQVYGSMSSTRDDSISAAGLPGVKPTKKVNDHTPGPPDKTKGKPVNIKGIIASADAGSIVVTRSDGVSVTVMITADTRILVSSMGKGSGIANLLPGLQVGIQAIENDGNLTARSIHVIPGKPAQSHNVGVVSDYQPGISITIISRDGVAYTFRLIPDAKILPEERLSLLVAGAYVTVISPRDVTTTDLIATGIVIHPAIPPGQEKTPMPTSQSPSGS